MADAQRFPLYAPLLQRDATSDKDALAKNVFYDSVESMTYATKRPGIEAYISATGEGLGIFFYDEEVFTFTDQNKFFDTYSGGFTDNLTTHTADIGGSYQYSNLLTQVSGYVQTTNINQATLDAYAVTDFAFTDSFGLFSYKVALQAINRPVLYIAFGLPGSSFLDATVAVFVISTDQFGISRLTSNAGGVSIANTDVTAYVALGDDNPMIIDINETDTKVYVNNFLVHTLPPCVDAYSIVGQNIKICLKNQIASRGILSEMGFTTNSTFPLVT